MRRARMASLAVVVATLLGCGDAPTEGSTGIDTAPSLLIAGQLTADRYPNVGLMVGRAAEDLSWGPVCTGTLVSPSAVLTAAHCVAFARLFEGFSQFGVMFGPTLTSASQVVRATPVVHPEFNFRFPFPTLDDPADFADLALLLLEHQVSIVPAQLPPAGFLDRMDRRAGPLTVVGYGIPRSDAPWTERGTRRVGAVRLDGVVGPVVGTLPDPAVICTGDSGAPLMLGPGWADRGARGVTTVLGVATTGDCATFSVFYRVDTPRARSFLGAYLDLPGRSASP